MSETTTTRQVEQQTAINDAMQAPGVREVLEVYGPISGYTQTRIVQPQPHVAYATGGNVNG